MKGRIEPSANEGAESVESREEQAYIFVLSPPYSGSTVLHHLLATSPAVSKLPTEGQHVEGAAGEMRGRHWDVDKEIDWPRISKTWHSLWNTDSPLLLEKSPPNLLRADKLQEHFSPAYFVIMMRDPYAFAEGIRRQNNEFDMIRGTKLWVRIARYQLRNAERLDRTLTVNYREFTDNTERFVEELLDWCPQLRELDADRVVGWSRTREERKIRNLNSLQKRILTAWDVKRINSVLDEVPHLMESFDYRYLAPSIIQTADSWYARLERKALSLVRFRNFMPDAIRNACESFVYRDLDDVTENQ